MVRGSLRTQLRHNRRRIGGLSVGTVRMTGGYVDPSSVVDYAEVKRRRAAKVASARTEQTVGSRKEKAREITRSAIPLADRHAAHIQAWEDAEPGTDKRTALAQLRRFEKRHGLGEATKGVAVEIVSAAGSLAPTGS